MPADAGDATAADQPMARSKSVKKIPNLRTKCFIALWILENPPSCVAADAQILPKVRPDGRTGVRC